MVQFYNLLEFCPQRGILPVFFDSGEVLFDGVEIRGIRREEEDVVPVPLCDSCQLLLIVELGIIPYNG